MSAVWLANNVLSALVAECDRMSPLETGGVLLGYWTKPEECPVITYALGPGKHAIHEHTAFLPDQEWHERAVAELYKASGRRLQYLGDWHSHPNGGAALSDLDRRTLARIAASRAARSPRPLMLVMSPGPLWQATVWQGFPRRGLLQRQRLDIRQLDVFAYGPASSKTNRP